MGQYQFARETYVEIVEDMQPLLVEHYEELAFYAGDVPLDPDYAFYRAAEKQGWLSIYSVRNNGVLVGYAVYLVRAHHHYRTTKWALSDIILVAKEHRGYGAGNGLFNIIEADLRLQGVQVMHTTTKDQHPELAKLLQHRGHAVEGHSFSKRL